MRRVIGWSWKALVVLACVAYQYLVYSSVSNAQPGPLHLILIWLPLAVLAGWIVVRSTNKLLWLTALLAMGFIVYLLEHQDRLGLAATSGISHTAAYLFMLWYFGHTLARGREPAITRFARRVHGALPPGMELFTRRLTIAWCAFFIAQLSASALLLAFAPLGVWSLFINLLNLPLLAVMFVGQMVYRAIRHPEFPRVTVLQAIESFTKDSSLSNSAEMR
ncbi:MAG TPA: hypothetical protein VFR39_00370 [Burkholderiales bacterium]|nr:hypothetical protein [Burkholderiales bacterium]